MPGRAFLFMWTPAEMGLFYALCTHGGMPCARGSMTSGRPGRPEHEPLGAQGALAHAGSLAPRHGGLSLGHCELALQPGVLGAEGSGLVNRGLELPALAGDRATGALGGREVPVRLLGVDGGLTGPGVRHESRGHTGKAEAGAVEGVANLVGGAHGGLRLW